MSAIFLLSLALRANEIGGSIPVKEDTWDEVLGALGGRMSLKIKALTVTVSILYFVE